MKKWFYEYQQFLAPLAFAIILVIVEILTPYIRNLLHITPI